MRPLPALLTAPALSFLGVAPGQIKNFVSFGDSYTDIYAGSDGGTPWPYYVAGYDHINMFSVAHNSAVCSQALTPHSTYPDIVTNEIPQYLAAKNSLGFNANETVFTIWIGVNDMGVLWANAETPGVTYENTTQCAVNWLKTLYDNGARNFIYMNIVPLNHAPIYSGNDTAAAWMAQTIPAANAYASQLLRASAAELAGTHIGYFDAHSFVQNVFDFPYSGVLNGTMAPNVTGYITRDCPQCTLSDRDSWMWFDNIHPSEQMDRQVAKWMSLALNGTGDSIYVTWYS